MTRKVFEAALDCTSRIKDITPPEEKIKEMFSFLSMVGRLSEICTWEGPSGLMLEAGVLPENTAYEKAFKESIQMWVSGSSIDEASDNAASRYFEENPSGYDAAIFFSAVFSIDGILSGGTDFGFMDMGLQYLLPDGWRWYEEDERENEAHKDDKDWFPLAHSHREKFLGDPKEEIQHRFDGIKVCKLLTDKDDIAERVGRRIADALDNYADGALQLILTELTYPELEKSLYVLPEEAEDRIISNLDPGCATIIKGHCILNKDSVNVSDIRKAVNRFEEEINAYEDDPSLEAGYGDI